MTRHPPPHSNAHFRVPIYKTRNPDDWPERTFPAVFREHQSDDDDTPRSSPIDAPLNLSNLSYNKAAPGIYVSLPPSRPTKKRKPKSINNYSSTDQSDDSPERPETPAPRPSASNVTITRAGGIVYKERHIQRALKAAHAAATRTLADVQSTSQSSQPAPSPVEAPVDQLPPNGVPAATTSTTATTALPSTSTAFREPVTQTSTAGSTPRPTVIDPTRPQSFIPEVRLQHVTAGTICNHWCAVTHSVANLEEAYITVLTEVSKLHTLLQLGGLFDRAGAESAAAAAIHAAQAAATAQPAQVTPAPLHRPWETPRPEPVRLMPGTPAQVETPPIVRLLPQNNEQSNTQQNEVPQISINEQSSAELQAAETLCNLSVSIEDNTNRETVCTNCSPGKPCSSCSDNRQHWQEGADKICNIRKVPLRDLLARCD